jgi:hypothetical protein
LYVWYNVCIFLVFYPCSNDIYFIINIFRRKDVKKTLKVVPMLLILLVSIMGCDLFGLMELQVVVAFEALNRSISEATSSTVTYTVNDSGEYVFTAPESGVTMTIAIVDSTETEYDVNISVDNYVDSISGYTISGSLSFGVTSALQTVTGNLLYTGGVVTTCVVDYVLDVAAGTATGTITANGKEFDASRLGTRLKLRVILP